MLILGNVVRINVPMIITFDKVHVEYIAEHLGKAIETSYAVYSMFASRDDDGEDDPFGQG